MTFSTMTNVVCNTLNNVACSDTSNCVTIMVGSLTAGTISANQSICNNTLPAQLTGTTGTGSGVLSYQWLSNTTGCNGPWSVAAGTNNGQNYQPGALTVTTYYKRVTMSTLNNMVCRDTSNCVTITFSTICHYYGCSPGFWKNHTSLWEQFTDYTPAHMPAGLKFITTTSYFTYFGLAPGANGFPTNSNFSMHDAIAQGGGACMAFSRHAVSALLTSASGLNIQYPTGTYDFTSLYNAIRTALQTGNCQGTLFTQLEAISQADDSMCGIFNSTPLPPFLIDPVSSAKNTLNDKSVTVPVEEPKQGKAHFTMSPNPANDMVNFNFVPEENGKLKIILTDVLGKLITNVFEAEADKGKQYFANLDIHNLSQGVYFIHFQNGNHVITQKLLIAR